MAMAGLYRRILPSPPAIDFSSTEGKKLFVEAIQNGTMEGFYKLVSFFQTQSEPAFCGLASLSMVLNALAIDPGRKWKGPWRWFDESMLDCCEPLEKVKAKGISFGKLVCLAQCAGAKVDAYRTSQSTIKDFRKHVISCSSSDDCHIISSYHRATLKQTGTGHFSPIGGYHAEKDMALILDVARFKYPPHWVPVTLLWEAMDQADEATGQQRGHESWIGISKYLMDEVPLLLRSEDVKDIKAVLSVVFTSLPSNFAEFIKWVAEIRRREENERSLSEEERSRLAIKEEVLKQVQDTGLFGHVVEFLSSAKSCCGHIPTIHEDNMREIAENVCCQGAEILAGKSGFLKGYCCGETCMKCLKVNGDKPITVVSGTVVMGDSEQKVDMLVPSSQRKSCCGASQNHYSELHPNGDDILTALLLALPPETWSGIKDKKLVQELNILMSTENLPTLLQEEVFHLRRQLYLLKRCQENKVDQDLTAPLT